MLHYKNAKTSNYTIHTLITYLFQIVSFLIKSIFLTENVIAFI